MGPRNFFPWIHEQGYVPEHIYISAQSHLLIDIKNILYQLASTVPTTDPDFNQTVATLVLDKFAPFKFVLLVNDGKITESHPKYEECCKRGRVKEKLQEAVKRQKTQEFGLVQVTSEQEDDDDNKSHEEEEVRFNSYRFASKLERQARAARGMSFEASVSILELVKAQQKGNISVLQCDTEADQQIMMLAPQFDFTVSRDADLLLGGGRRQIVAFGTPQQAVYNIERICAVLGLTLVQLQEIVSMSGNDYTQGGIRGMGLKKAYGLIQKYGSCKRMLRKWTKLEQKQFIVPANFLEQLQTSVAMYSGADWEGSMDKSKNVVT